MPSLEDLHLLGAIFQKSTQRELSRYPGSMCSGVASREGGLRHDGGSIITLCLFLGEVCAEVATGLHNVNVELTNVNVLL